MDKETFNRILELSGQKPLLESVVGNKPPQFVYDELDTIGIPKVFHIPTNKKPDKKTDNVYDFIAVKLYKEFQRYYSSADLLMMSVLPDEGFSYTQTTDPQERTNLKKQAAPIAKAIIKDTTGKPDTVKHFKKFFYIMVDGNSFNKKLTHIKDTGWFNSKKGDKYSLQDIVDNPVNPDKISQELVSIDKIIKIADVWDANKKGDETELPEGDASVGKIIKKYPEYNLHWVEYIGGACTIDNFAVGCGSNRKANRMFTLKEEGERGVVTVAAKIDNKISYYIEAKGGLPKGEQNIKPEEKYWPMIEDLFKIKNIVGYEPSTAYQPENDFKPEDLVSVDLQNKFKESNEWLSVTLPKLNDELEYVLETDAKDEMEFQWDTIKGYIEKGADIYNEVLARAVELNNFEMVKYIVDKGANNFVDITTFAVKNNNIEMLNYGIEQGSDDFANITYDSTHKNNLEMIKHVIEEANKRGKSDSIDFGTVSVIAIRNSFVKIIKYLVEAGHIPASSMVAYGEVSRDGNKLQDSFEILKYLFEKIREKEEKTGETTLPFFGQEIEIDAFSNSKNILEKIVDIGKA